MGHIYAHFFRAVSLLNLSRVDVCAYTSERREDRSALAPDPSSSLLTVTLDKQKQDNIHKAEKMRDERDGELSLFRHYLSS